ncbi:MAG: hypothetical protein NWE93_06785 [Candidatus Bathyarchaeota archaeon]|nr:hypothetical protein [Candidatus Bathyarchaeota archaeon]
MPSFSVPADFQPSTIEKFAARNQKWEIPVKDVYGSLNPSIFGSGRTSSVLRQTKFGDLQKYVEACNSNGITFNYTLNFNCISNMEFTDKGKKEILGFIHKLYSIGIKRFTAVLPSVMLLLKDNFPDVKVTVSVISNVDSYTRLKAFLAAGNIDRIMIPESMNRKMARLEKLTAQGKELGVEFGTIVNGLCLIDCPFREYHYSFNSHALGGKKFKPGDYYVSRCSLTKLENPAEVLKMGWIRPEDLHHYVDAGIEVFKIAGRETTKPDFIRVVDVYNQGTYDGNLWELFRSFSVPPEAEALNYAKMITLQNRDLGAFTKRFFVAKSFCTTKDCETCNYCTDNAHLVQVNDYARWKQTLETDLSFFNKGK